MVSDAELDRLVCHPSVLSRVWNIEPSDPWYLAARRFFDEVIFPQRIRLLAVEGIEFRILTAWAELYRLTGESIGEDIADTFFDDVLDTVGRMTSEGVLETVPL